MTEELQHALEYATYAHRGQVRKYTGEPYIGHPVAVAVLTKTLLEFHCYNKDSVILGMKCALLHDVVEDTTVTIEDIKETFGDEVARGVWFLTDADTFVGNRATRKALTRARFSCAPDYIKLVKQCDLKHNAASIRKYDPDFYKVFIKETTELMKVLQR
jgi:(p)ppGpp synthase/HD superfamily hydrolase